MRKFHTSTVPVAQTMRPGAECRLCGKTIQKQSKRPNFSTFSRRGHLMLAALDVRSGSINMNVQLLFWNIVFFENISRMIWRNLCTSAETRRHRSLCPFVWMIRVRYRTGQVHPCLSIYGQHNFLFLMGPAFLFLFVFLFVFMLVFVFVHIFVSVFKWPAQSLCLFEWGLRHVHL